MSAGTSRAGSKGSTCKKTLSGLHHSLPQPRSQRRDKPAAGFTLQSPHSGALVFMPHVPVFVESPYEALKEENGSFEVVSPAGDIVRVSCRPGQPISAQWVKVSPELRRSDYLWRVTRLSDNPDFK